MPPLQQQQEMGLPAAPGPTASFRQFLSIFQQSAGLRHLESGRMLLAASPNGSENEKVGQNLVTRYQEKQNAEAGAYRSHFLVNLSRIGALTVGVLRCKHF